LLVPADTFRSIAVRVVCGALQHLINKVEQFVPVLDNYWCF